MLKQTVSRTRPLHVTTCWRSSFFLRSDAQYRLTGTALEGVCFKLHPQAIPGFERIAEHEVFGFCVDVKPKRPAPLRCSTSRDDVFC
jgi:hypothetical protein